jgi:hypothetical protein
MAKVSNQREELSEREIILQKELQETKDECDSCILVSERHKKELQEKLSDRELELEKQRDRSTVMESVATDSKEECARLVSENSLFSEDHSSLESKLARLSKQLVEATERESALKKASQESMNACELMKFAHNKQEEELQNLLLQSKRDIETQQQHCQRVKSLEHEVAENNKQNARLATETT